MSKTRRNSPTDDRSAARAARTRRDWDNWASWSRDEKIAAAAPGLEALRTTGLSTDIPALYSANDRQWAGHFAARSAA